MDEHTHTHSHTHRHQHSHAHSYTTHSHSFTLFLVLYLFLFQMSGYDGDLKKVRSEFRSEDKGIETFTHTEDGREFERSFVGQAAGRYERERG